MQLIYSIRYKGLIDIETAGVIVFIPHRMMGQNIY